MEEVHDIDGIRYLFLARQQKTEEEKGFSPYKALPFIEENEAEKDARIITEENVNERGERVSI